MKKRTISFFLALMLVFGCVSALPLGALAQEPTAEAEWGASETQMSESGTLSQAIAYAKQNAATAYIRLLSDVEGSYIFDGVTCVLDLNGKTIISNGYTLDVRCGGSLTLTDTQGTGEVISTLAGSAAILAFDNATLTIEGGTYRSNHNCAVSAYGGTHVTLRGGVFIPDQEIVDAVSIDVSGSDSTLTVEGGRFVYPSDGRAISIYDATLVLKDYREEALLGVDYYGGGLLNLQNASATAIEKLRLFPDDDDFSIYANSLLPADLNWVDLGLLGGYPCYGLGEEHTAPVLVGNLSFRLTADELELHLFTDEKLARVYYAYVPRGDAAPTLDGASAAWKEADLNNRLFFTDLPAGALDLYLILTDILGNESEVYSLSIPAISYDVIVDGIVITDENKSDVLGDRDGAAATVRYDGTMKTLTLDGATLTSTAPDALYGIIRFYSSLNIVLKGENTLTSTYLAGIYSEDGESSLQITGDGSLTFDTKYSPVYIHNDLDISVTLGGSTKIYMDTPDEGIWLSSDEGAVCLTVKDNARLEIQCKEECIYIEAAEDCDVYMKDNAYVYLSTDDEEAIYLYSEWESSTLTVSGNAYVFADGDEEGLDCDSVTLKGGTLIAYSYESDEQAISCTELTVTGGRLIAIGSIVTRAFDFNILGGEVILLVKPTGDRILFEEELPSLGDYTGDHTPLLLTAEGEYVPYSEEHAGAAMGFVLAEKTQKVVMPAISEKIFLPPIFTDADTYVFDDAAFAAKEYHEITGIAVGEEEYALGAEIPLFALTVACPIYTPIKQENPVIQASDSLFLELYEYEGEKYFYIYNNDYNIPYTGTLTLTGSGENVWLFASGGEHELILDGVTLTHNDYSTGFGIMAGVLHVTFRGDSSISSAGGIIYMEGGEIAITFEAGSSLSLSSEGSFILEFTEGVDEDAFTLRRAGGTHIHTGEGSTPPADGEVAAAILTLLQEENAVTISAHAYIEVESEAAKLQAPTCTENGTYYTSCEACGALGTDTFTVAAKGHHYTNGVCDICGEADPSKPDSLLWLWITLPAVAVCGTAAALYWFVFKKKKI